MIVFLPPGGDPVRLIQQMFQLPKIFKLVSGLVLILVFLAGCTTQPKHRPLWYDFRTQWHNNDVGNSHSWWREDPRAIRKALRERHVAWRRATVKKLRRLLAENKKIRRKSRYKRRKKYVQKNKPRRVTRKNVVAKVSKRPVVPPIEGLILGDGSISSELIAAARRIVGSGGGFIQDSFLRHILATAAISAPIKTTPERFLDAVFDHYAKAGKAFAQGRPKPGAIVFFRHTGGAEATHQEKARTSAAIVQKVRSDGVLVCIGPVLGVVKRFHVDPYRPTVQRNEQTQLPVNDIMRARTLDSRTRIPVLAGGLWAGYAQL